MSPGSLGSLGFQDHIWEEVFRWGRGGESLRPAVENCLCSALLSGYCHLRPPVTLGKSLSSSGFYFPQFGNEDKQLPGSREEGRTR